MKIFKRMTVFLLALCVTGSLSITAAAAEKKEYTYTVRFFSGARGTFGGKELVTFKNLKEGDRVSFRQSDVTLEEGSKYYIKGIRESGRDNNTVSSQSSFVVTEDRDYVVAYGIKGNSVGYTVRYVDTDGRQLLPDETYYGNIGDRPVIAYQYVENYRPQAYNLTGTLKENEAENVFTFTYTAIDRGNTPAAPETPAQNQTPQTAPAAPAAGGAAAAPAAGGAAGAGAGAGDAAAPAAGGAAGAGDVAEGGETEGTPDAPAEPAGGEEEPAALQDIQDGEVPLANIGEDQLTNVNDEPTPLSSGDFAKRVLDIPAAAKVGIISLLVLLGAGGAYLYIKKKREKQNAE